MRGFFSAANISHRQIPRSLDVPAHGGLAVLGRIEEESVGSELFVQPPSGGV